MNTIFLRMLRHEASSWWANTTPDLVRKDVREKLKTIRRYRQTEELYITVGPGGTAIRAENSTLSWPGQFEKWPTAQVFRILGAPLIDLRTMPNPAKIISLPLCCPGRNDYHDLPGPLSYVDLETYKAHARKFGATVYE